MLTGGDVGGGVRETEDRVTKSQLIRESGDVCQLPVDISPDLCSQLC